MCLIAVFCWCLIIFEEISSVIRFVLAVLSMPRARKTFFVHRETEHEGGIAVDSLSWGRLVAALLVSAVRLAVAVLLGFSGTDFLVYTQTTQDLVLNAVALEFVLSIDELLFRVAAPARVRGLLSRLEELPIRRKAVDWRGINFTAFAMLLCPVAACAFTVAFRLQPALRDRAAAWECICGGNKMFVVATDGLGRAHWSPSEPFRGEGGAGASTYLHTAVLAVRDDSDRQAGLIRQESSLNQLRQAVKQPVSVMSAMLSCVDADLGIDDSQQERPWSMGQLILTKAYVQNGSASVDSCADVRPLCWQPDLPGIRARQWCPVTCGCASDGTGLLLVEPSLGCPVSCDSKYKYALQSAKCAERVLNDTVHDPGFTAYVQGLQTLFSIRTFEAPDIVALSHRMAELGCAAVADGGPVGEALCTGVAETINGTAKRRFRPVTSFCPVACGCDGSGLPGHKHTLAERTKEASDSSSGTLVLSGDCNRRMSLAGEYFFIGSAANGAPVFRSPAGYYIYYGPDCGPDDAASRWVLSPDLCNGNFMDAYILSRDPRRPPERGEWAMACLDDWQRVNLTLTQAPE